MIGTDRGTLIGDDYSVEAWTTPLSNFVQEMGKIDAEYDTIVVTGLSGTVFGARIAGAVDKNLMIVRKPDDSSNHSSYGAEGFLGERWIFADDFLSSGATAKRVWDYMEDHHPTATCVGVFEYACSTNGRWTNLDWLRDPAEIQRRDMWGAMHTFARHVFGEVQQAYPRTWEDPLAEPIDGWDPARFRVRHDHVEDLHTGIRYPVPNPSMKWNF